MKVVDGLSHLKLAQFLQWCFYNFVVKGGGATAVLAKHALHFEENHRHKDQEFWILVCIFSKIWLDFSTLFVTGFKETFDLSL